VGNGCHIGLYVDWELDPRRECFLNILGSPNAVHKTQKRSTWFNIFKNTLIVGYSLEKGKHTWCVSLKSILDVKIVSEETSEWSCFIVEVHSAVV